MCFEPCEDCPWKLLIQMERPVFAVKCNVCGWYIPKTAVPENDDNVDSYTVTLDGPYGDKEDIKKLLRCDGVAPFLFFGYENYCAHCRVSVRDHKQRLLVPRTTFFAEKPLLHRIEHLTWAEYNNLQLPAYTLQYRCGARPRLTEIYLEFKPDAKVKVEKHRAKRTEERRRFAQRRTERALND